jgi:predicted DNA-binding transcriptional regulator AlpA
MGGAGRSLLIEEAAGLLGVSRRTVYYRIRDGLTCLAFFGPAEA